MEIADLDDGTFINRVVRANPDLTKVVAPNTDISFIQRVDTAAAGLVVSIDAFQLQLEEAGDARSNLVVVLNAQSGTVVSVLNLGATAINVGVLQHVLDVAVYRRHGVHLGRQLGR